MPAKTKKAAPKASLSTPLKGKLNLITCVLQRGKAGFEALARRVAAARIVEPEGLARFGLRERGGQDDVGHDPAVRGVRLLAGVNGQSLDEGLGT